MSENPFQVHVRQLEKRAVHLQGEVPFGSLGLELGDELVHVRQPLHYELKVELLGRSILVQGALRLSVDFECVRCLKPFNQVFELRPWACHVPLEGEDSVVLAGDAVDLTPYIREDILLAFPQHPLCESKCSGLPGLVTDDGGKQSVAHSADLKSGSVWDQLDKLKLG